MASQLPRPINIILTILSGLGLTLWTAGVFLGLYFFSGGSLGLSIPVALATGGLMALFMWFVRRYTRFSAISYRKKDSDRYRWLYLGLYVLMTVGSVWFVMHAVAVTTTIKSDYRDATIKDLAGLYNLVDKRAPDGSYQEYVGEQVRRYRQGNGHKDSSTLDFECSQLEQILTKTSGFNTLQKEIEQYWSEADYTVKNWDLWYLPSTVKTFHDSYPGWKKSLEECSNAGNSGIYTTLHTPYKVKFTPETDLYYSFSSVSGADFNVWSILVVILLQILILGAWLAMLQGGQVRAEGVSKATIDRGGPSVWEAPTWNPNDD